MGEEQWCEDLTGPPSDQTIDYRGYRDRGYNVFGVGDETRPRIPPDNDGSGTIPDVSTSNMSDWLFPATDFSDGGVSEAVNELLAARLNTNAPIPRSNPMPLSDTTDSQGFMALQARPQSGVIVQIQDPVQAQANAAQAIAQQGIPNPISDLMNPQDIDDPSDLYSASPPPAGPRPRHHFRQPSGMTDFGSIDTAPQYSEASDGDFMPSTPPTFLHPPTFAELPYAPIWRLLGRGEYNLNMERGEGICNEELGFWDAHAVARPMCGNPGARNCDDMFDDAAHSCVNCHNAQSRAARLDEQNVVELSKRGYCDACADEVRTARSAGPVPNLKIGRCYCVGALQGTWICVRYSPSNRNLVLHLLTSDPGRIRIGG